MVSPLSQAKVFLDFVLQPFADFLFPVHRQDGGMPAKPNFEVAALGGGERASLLFQPSLELAACHDSRIQQECFVFNRTVVLRQRVLPISTAQE
jgi:hypothetical protein